MDSAKTSRVKKKPTTALSLGQPIRQYPFTDPEILHTLIDASHDMIFIVDYQTMRYLYVNDTACELGGYSREDYLKIKPYDTLMITPEELRQRYALIIEAGPRGTTSERRVKLKGGGRSILEFFTRALNINGRWILIIIARDISQRFLTEEPLQRLSRMYAALSATNEASMRTKTPEALYHQVCYTAVNDGRFTSAAVFLYDSGTSTLRLAAANGVGWQELEGPHSLLAEVPEEKQDIISAAFRLQKVSVNLNATVQTSLLTSQESTKRAVFAAAVPLLKGTQSIGVLLFQSENKRTFDQETITLLERMAENVVFALENFEHEAERRRKEERIQYLATHDALTGLPNRLLFSQLLSHTLQSARRYTRQFAVLFIDLDRFKIINDTLGHGAGDQLLQEISRRLHQILREIDIIARMGGDEFIILIDGVSDPSQTVKVAQKILSAVIKPMILQGQEYRITASIGTALYPKDALDEQSLIRQADIDMYLAKEEGKNNFQFYSKELKSRSFERLTLERYLRSALEHHEFFLHYQAKLDFKTNTITGVEALLRWQNPELGSVSPTRFIPMAEDIGLIVPIGRWVLKTACTQNAAWQSQGLPEVCIAVNLSVRQIMDTNIVSDIQTALKESGLKPHLLELEITESTLIQNPERVIRVLNEIKKIGVRLAIDDFGTGYSSLSQIKHFPIDTLKVDRSFIRDLMNNNEDRAITEAIIAMGWILSLTVVAEGVETKEQEAFLRSQSCDEMQGFYFSKPTPPDQFADLLRRYIPVPCQ